MKLIKIITRLSLGAIAFIVLTYRPNVTLAYDAPPVMFYEIAWAGSSISTSDEWVVLKNNTDQLIDLGGWTMRNSDSSMNIDIGDAQIAANGYLLVANNGKDYLFTKGRSVLNIEPDVINSAISLSNSKLKLLLYQGEDIVDVAGDGKTPLAGSSTPSHASMVRVSPQSDGKLKESWFTNQNRANLDSGVPDFGTPKVGVPYATVAGWKEFGEIGQGFDATISVSHSSGTAIMSIIENGNIIETDLKSGDKKTIEISCPNVGQQTIAIVVIDNAGMKYSLAGELYCYQFADLVINEVMPAPKSGEKEWIEIYNPSNYSVGLKYWQLADTIKVVSIDDDLVVRAKGYLVLSGDQLGGINLNNSGDSITLSSPEGDETDEVGWNDALSALTYAKFGKLYKWTAQPTPGKANIYIPAPSDSEEMARPATVPDVPTGDADRFINKWITIEGEVVENSGDTFYIDDGSGRVRVYIQGSTDIDKPSMHKGDIFRVTGIMNIYRVGDEPRLLPRQINDIELIQSSQEDEGADASEISETAFKLSSAKKLAKATKSVITTKRMLNNPQLLAAMVKPFNLPKLPTRISFDEVSPSSPILPTGETVAELTIGGVGLLAIAKMLKIMVKLWL